MFYIFDHSWQNGSSGKPWKRKREDLQSTEMNYDAEYRTTSQSSYSLTITSSTSSRAPLHPTRAEGKTPRSVRPDHVRTLTKSVSIVTDLQSEDIWHRQLAVFSVVSAKRLFANVTQGPFRWTCAIPVAFCCGSFPSCLTTSVSSHLRHRWHAPVCVPSLHAQRQDGNMGLNVHRNHTAY